VKLNYKLFGATTIVY